jgi:hypothetical protein
MSGEYGGPEDRLALYEALVAGNDEVERRGATMPYTSHNGHTFSFLDASGAMALRLSADDRATFTEQYQTTIADQYGRQMKEFVVVPDDLLERTDEFGTWLGRSHEWIGTLKPKPTRRG